MADLLQALSDIVWAESFWLPGNRTWDVLKNTEGGIYHAQLSDLVVSVYLSVAVYIVKYIFERFVFGTIGHALGLKSVVKKAAPNPILENSYKQRKSPSNETIQGLAKQTDLTSRQIERWFRIRRNQDRAPVFKKFCESSWRGLFYFCIFWWGVYLHLDHVSDDVYWYYMVEAAFYLSLLFSLFSDHKRKDFVEMVVHHVATLMLMTLSWANNFVRVGTLVLLVHDAVDSWMETAKVAKYLGYEKACEILFFIFMVVWIITRMILFPFRIIYSTMFESLPGLKEERNGLFTIYVVYNFLLCTLQVLHIIWFYYISIIAYDALRGQLQKDSRSSLESASDSDDGESKRTTAANGKNSNEADNISLNGVVKPKSKKAS